TVRIAAGSSADAGDVLGVRLAMTGDLVNGTSIHVHYNAANGTLLLSGSDTAANYQNVLQHVVYSSTSQNPDHFGEFATRSIDIQVNDGSTPAGPMFGTATPVAAGTNAWGVTA